MRRGVSFEIPNHSGCVLSDVLKPIRISDYDWLLDGCEWHIVQHERLQMRSFFQVIKTSRKAKRCKHAWQTRLIQFLQI